MDTFGKFDNPVNSCMKESEPCSVKFGFNDNEHIYDDPNLLFDAKGNLESPEPYLAAHTGIKDQAKLQPPSAAAVPSKDISDPSSEPRYMSINEQPSVTAPPPSTFLPPGYSSPRSPCVPKLSEDAIPDYDDCLSKPTTTQPTSKPKAPWSQDYSKLLHQASMTAQLPPGYASPKSVGCLESQMDMGEEETTTSSFKAQVETEKEDLVDAKDQSVYFPLRIKSMQKEGAYQEVMNGSKPSNVNGGQPAIIPSEDEYVAMNSPTHQ